jgi:hypothetical protein
MKTRVRLITIFVIALALVIPSTSASAVSMFKFKRLGRIPRLPYCRSLRRNGRKADTGDHPTR